MCDFHGQPINGTECGLCRRERAELAAERNAEWWSS